MTTPEFRTVPEAILHWATVSPDAPAALSPGLPALDYGSLWRVTRQIAAVLAEAGVAPGERVALFIPQSRDAEVVNTAVSAMAVPVPLNPAAPPAALRLLGNRLGPAIAIATRETEAAAAALDCPVLLLDPGWLIPGASPAIDPAPRSPEDPAIILTTSGTTGEPRLIPRTHGQLAVSTAAWMERLEFTRDNLGLIAAPPYHAMGTVFFRHVLAGSAALIHPAADMHTVLTTIRETPPTWILGVPSWYAALMAADDAPLPRLRMLMSGSAPMPASLAETLSRRFDAPMIFDYGLSEAPCLALSDPHDEPGAEPRYLPLLPNTVRIAGPDGAPRSPGEEGELVIGGPIVFPGSIGATVPERDPDGWYRTGDLGVLDPEGRFRVTGRLKHLINRGGEMISPLEIERVLLAHPAVADAAAIGAPHPVLGEDIIALVVLHPGQEVSRRDLRRWLLDRLAPTKVPRELDLRERLPLLPSGKLDRRALQAEAVARAAQSRD